ncbi:MAG TPA: ATP-dependent DNA helicase RecG [Jiangellaceae bacterium]|nr:ATP-dependent DNA helicase RecG [Jiangellaceae bacterium]
MGLSFSDPLDRLLGRRTAKILAESLDLHTAGDLLRHYPRRYAQRGELTDLDALRIDEHVTVLAKVKSAHLRPMRSRRGWMLEAQVTDGYGELSLTFFGKSERALLMHTRQLRAGRIGLFAGKVSQYQRKRQLTHPEYNMLDDLEDTARAVQSFAGQLIPVYPATGKLPTWRISQSVGTLLDQLDYVREPIPASLRNRLGLMDADRALRVIHQPKSLADVEKARHRLRFEEAFVLQVELARRRASVEALPAVARPARAEGLRDRFDSQLPFDLTKAQVTVGDEIAADLAQRHPMHRLLQGEVGSGKTVVALRAMLQVVDSGGQAALLAPTEVLAHQHYRTLRQLLGPLAEGGMLGGSEIGTQIALLTGSMAAAARRPALLAAASGQAGIVVGTHALLEEHVQFADLGLVVVDEQHRFGVEQRAALAEKGPAGTRPHVLVMTATPIPRTVAMTVFGDLWVSTMSELPAGRADVETHVVSVAEKPQYLDRAWQRIREEVAAGQRVYVVCPRIGGDFDNGPETAGGAAAEQADRRPVAVMDVAEMLRAGPLGDVPVGILHGRMAPEDKDEAMRRFAAGDVPVLVATTVIEVGVDVPTASMMVVMDATRFGVSQLHQLRGRIGRSNIPSLCLLVTDTPAGTTARDRLDAVAKSHDGFYLAQVDLEQRREGDILGVEQSGRRSSLRLLRVLRDENLIMVAREAAGSVVTSDPELERHPDLAAAVAELGVEERDYLEKA